MRITVKEAPLNMILAMGITAFLCIGIGIYPSALYSFLPFDVSYHPYTFGHVITSLQLLVFAALAFLFLIRTGLYPAETPSTNLDFDWVYRRIIPRFLGELRKALNEVDRQGRSLILAVIAEILTWANRYHGINGMMSRTYPAGIMVFWTLAIFLIFLILYLTA